MEAALSSPTFTTVIFWPDCQAHQTIPSAVLSISSTGISYLPQTEDNRLTKDSLDMSRDLAARVHRFRALVVGRANAGKTTLLRCIAQSADGRVCTVLLILEACFNLNIGFPRLTHLQKCVPSSIQIHS